MATKTANVTARVPFSLDIPAVSYTHLDVYKRQVYNIGICQQLEHPALDQATQGFEDVLKEKLGDNVKFDLQKAQKDVYKRQAWRTGYMDILSSRTNGRTAM